MHRLLFLVSLIGLSTPLAYGQKKVPMTLADLPLAIDTLTGSMRYVQVVEVPNVPANLLYDRTKTWLVDSFRSAKAIIDNEDRASGTLTAKPVFTITAGKGGVFNTHVVTHRALVDIRCKDNRYRCEIHVLDVIVSPTSQATLPIEVTNKQNIGFIRKKGFLYEREALEIQQVDAYYLAVLEEIKKAASIPGKGEF